MLPILGAAVVALPLDPELRARLLMSAGIIAALALARWAVIVVVQRRVTVPRVRYRWRKGATYAAVATGAALVGWLWVPGLGALATFLGLVSAGIAIALKDPLTNLAGWFFIFWRRPFEVGDRVQLGDHAGDVVDLRLFQFTLLEIGRRVNADQPTGRLLLVPNGRVFTEVLANYTKGFTHVWNEVPVLITFESDWRKALALLEEVARRHGDTEARTAMAELDAASRRLALGATIVAPTVYLSVEASGVLLTIRTLCDPRGRRQVTHAIWQDVLTAFDAAPEIDLAYPTTRFYDYTGEGRARRTAPKGREGVPPQG